MARVILLFVFFVSTPASAQTEMVRQKEFNTESGLALAGYDPVTYFDGQPRKGHKGISHVQDGIRYHFINTRNRDRFLKSAGAFEPAYGGWCAYAMGESGEKVKVDPQTFKIIDGKLYLFYNFWGNNTLTSWNKNEKKLKTTADKNWQSIIRMPIE